MTRDGFSLRAEVFSGISPWNCVQIAIVLFTPGGQNQLIITVGLAPGESLSPGQSAEFPQICLSL
jgi:hypothetical protein